MATRTFRQPFALEQAYRKGFRPGLLDLSSSAAFPTTVRDLLGDSAADLLLDASLGYEPGGGSYELRAAVAALYDNLKAGDILITAGAVEAIRAVAMALVEPGDRVLVQTPVYGAVRQAVVDAGGEPIEWCGRPELQFDLRDVSTAGVSMALLNSPHGPSGSVVRGLEGLSGRLVVDEVYRPIGLVHGLRLPSCADTSETAVAIGDLSKPLGLGGLRIGWIASRDHDALRRCADAIDYLSGSVSSLSARVALEALHRFDCLLTPHLEAARENLSTLAAFVDQHRDLIDWTPPQAGYTACLRLRSGPPPGDFFARLRDRGIFMLDGAVLGLPDCLRVGLGMPADVFEQALAVLGKELAGQICKSANPQRARADADVIFYTKLPRPGEGKTRLAKDIGVDAAALLAGAFFDDSLRLAQGEASRLFVALSGIDDAVEASGALGHACVFPQRGDDMGQRLSHAFDDAFARGAQRPVLIGSDSPTLPAHLIGAAWKALRTHDVVIGPAVDGGYDLIGLREPAPSLFDGIDWSTERVLAQTQERAIEAGLCVFYLPQWYDIDTASDLQRLHRDVRPDSSTEAALRETTL